MYQDHGALVTVGRRANVGGLRLPVIYHDATHAALEHHFASGLSMHCAIQVDLHVG